jgi:putative FmdB family regulatory protein
MIYEYACDQCVRQFEVVKAMSESGRIEVCEKCGAQARRLWSAAIEHVGAKVKDAEYYHSLGRVVKNDRERKEIIKRYGLVEVGNERPERARYHMEKDRKERIRKRWEDE